MSKSPSKSELHLIFTSIITEKRRIIHKGSENLESRNRVEIFLSMLENLKLLPIETAEFYLEFDETTLWGKDLVLKSIADSPFKAKIIDSRLEYFKDWQVASNSAYVSQSKQLIFFANDDHNFIPSNIDEFKRILNVHIEISEVIKNKQILVALSHFPESHAMVPISDATGDLVEYKKDFLVPVVIPIGAIIIKPEDFISWFENDFTQGLRFVGPENPWGPSIRIKNGFYLIPQFELFRHFDGYSHIGLEGWPFQVMDSEIKTTKNPTMVVKHEIWQTSTRIKKPKNQNSALYLSDTKKVGDSNGFAASILKSNSIRLSSKSIKSLDSIYRLKNKQKFAVYVNLLLNSAIFRQSLLKFLPEKLLFFAFKILFKIKKFRSFINDNSTYHAIFLNGASHGYIRYFKILVLEKFRSSRKRKK
jgi:hypothetical protein